MNIEELPETLLQAIVYFSCPERSHNFLAEIVWPTGPECPHCGSQKVGVFSEKRKVSNCKNCKKQFTVKVGTIFESSPLGLDKWLPAVWLIACSKNGISSCEIARSLGVTQKTAWFMGHRIRRAIAVGSFKKFSGIVEVDETYIGGKAKNMHKGKRKARGTGMTGKTPVMGILDRCSRPSKIVAEVLPFITREGLISRVRKYVLEGSEVHTDSVNHYVRLREAYVHKFVDHALTYVKDGVHTNGLENFWNLLKRCIGGTYTFCEPKHLHRYVSEQVYRFNERKLEDSDRFVGALIAVAFWIAPRSKMKTAYAMALFIVFLLVSLHLFLSFQGFVFTAPTWLQLATHILNAIGIVAGLFFVHEQRKFYP